MSCLYDLYFLPVALLSKRCSSRRAYCMGGGLLTLTAMVLQIKIDWAEVGSTLAFTSWASILHPCAWCTAERVSLFMPVAADPCPKAWSAASPPPTGCAGGTAGCCGQLPTGGAPGGGTPAGAAPPRGQRGEARPQPEGVPCPGHFRHHKGSSFGKALDTIAPVPNPYSPQGAYCSTKYSPVLPSSHFHM